ncbi:MAG: 2-hydroxyglutaryl-CoA dehydratase [Peptococcaceae bacterium]|nr:2-hydroxyglutaryl-CoA dehydratase [Peptococcaceae bacterium]
MIAAGIDVGSLSAEAVLIKNRKVLGYSVVPTGADSRKAAEAALEAALSKTPYTKQDIGFTVATGYGRINVPYADRQVTEITCHARGAIYEYQDTRTVIDIGGQDSKVIKLDASGMVVDFTMNDKCAAGTGRFLEVMARALEVDLEDLSTLAQKARRASNISSTCTVFAESEVVSLIGKGTPREEIAQGLINSVADRTVNMVHRVGLTREVTMTGGVAKNAGVVRAIQERLGVEVRVPPEPQIIGALGAALLAWNEVSKRL